MSPLEFPSNEFYQADGKKRRVASKEMRSDMDHYYEKEADTLRIIRELKHIHLITPMAAYRRGELRGFLFPWAEGGNLREFWKRDSERPSKTPELMKWILDQFCGICDATKALHARNCRHTDLKPENILLFEENGPRGILRVADVGLAKFHNDATRQRDIKTNAMTGTVRYEPPEFGRDAQYSRVYDVWSLGCVFFEFLIWAVYGQRILDDFMRSSVEQQFWEKKGGEYHQHHEVKRWIEHMSKVITSEDPRSQTALNDCLVLIDKHMLVPEVEARTPAADLHVKFEKIRDKGGREVHYLLDSNLPSRISTQAPLSGKPGGTTLQVPSQGKTPGMLLASQLSRIITNEIVATPERVTKESGTSGTDTVDFSIAVPATLAQEVSSTYALPLGQY